MKLGVVGVAHHALQPVKRGEAIPAVKPALQHSPVSDRFSHERDGLRDLHRSFVGGACVSPGQLRSRTPRWWWLEAMHPKCQIAAERYLAARDTTLRRGRARWTHGILCPAKKERRRTDKLAFGIQCLRGSVFPHNIPATRQPAVPNI